MRTKKQYRENLSTLKRNIYYKGEKIGRDHEVFDQTIGVLGHTFDAAMDPKKRICVR